MDILVYYRHVSIDYESVLSVAMFAADPKHECPFLDFEQDKSLLCYRAFSLLTRFPWYLVTFADQTGEESILQTMVCATEADLVRLSKSLEPRLLSIQRMASSEADPAIWKASDIQRIWARPGSKNVDLVFEDSQGNCFDTWDDTKPVNVTGHQLLVALA